MELICEKYRERMAREQARCLRPNEYCKFRSACIINLLGRDRAREESGNVDRREQPTSKDEV